MKNQLEILQELVKSFQNLEFIRLLDILLQPHRFHQEIESHPVVGKTIPILITLLTSTGNLIRAVNDGFCRRKIQLCGYI